MAGVRGSLLRIEAVAPTATHRGTGFVVGPHLAATCAHLVRGTSSIAVLLADGRVFRARVERLDLLNDLALLSIPGDLPAALPLDWSGRVEPGEPIAVTGFPRSAENPEGAQDVTTPGTVVGWVTRNSPAGDRVQMLQVNADIYPGHSGGPVYSLRDGRVMGVMSFRVASDSIAGFAAGIPMLQHLWEVGSADPAPENTPEDLR